VVNIGSLCSLQQALWKRTCDTQHAWIGLVHLRQDAKKYGVQYHASHLKTSLGA